MSEKLFMKRVARFPEVAPRLLAIYEEEMHKPRWEWYESTEKIFAAACAVLWQELMLHPSCCIKKLGGIPHTSSFIPLSCYEGDVLVPGVKSYIDEELNQV